MSASTVQNSGKVETGLNRYGKKLLIREFIRVFVHAAILLISAGKIRWINAWVYAGLLLFYQMVYTGVMVKISPQLLNERGRGFREDTKPFDKLFFAFWIPLTFVTLIIAGLDAARFGWSTMPFESVILGVAMSIPTFIIVVWAMAVNPHFEGTVRIQEDRDHRVCASGPYRIVRHPGYVGMILSALGTPLILGSWWALVPGGMIVLLVVIRTALEDRTLQNELAGYREYTESTRYRLLPLVW